MLILVEIYFMLKLEWILKWFILPSGALLWKKIIYPHHHTLPPPPPTQASQTPTPLP